MRLSSLITAVVVGACILAPFIAFSKVGGGDITYTPKGASHVVFNHEYHVSLKAQRCNNCHYKTFQMTGGAEYKMDMSLLTKGKFCGLCHDGKKAFDVKDASSCKRCHKD
jgi:c(7)-type cytochrome triheme protein